MNSQSSILIVSGDEPARTSTARTLEQAGYSVTQTSQGEPALTIVRKQRPSLVLLDVFLSDISGPEVLRQIRLDPTLIDVSVVMISALEATPEQLASCLDTGADGFMAVAVPRGELLARVRSQLRRAELTTALRASERQFVTAFEDAAVGMALVVPSGKLVQVNRSLCKMLGYSKQDLLSRTVMELADPADVGVDARLIDRLLNGIIRTYQVEKKFVTAAGAQVWTSLSVSLVRDDAGRPVHFIAQVQDITSRKQAAEEIQRTTELIRAVVEGALDPIFVKDLEGRYLFVNDACILWAGRTREEVIHLNDTEIFGAEGAALLAQTDRRIAQTGQPENSEETLTSNGITRTFLANKSPYYDGNGNIIGVVGISRDITDRKLDEARIAAQADLIDRARDAIYQRDMDDRITFWSKGAERLYGYTAEEAVGARANILLRTDPRVFATSNREVRREERWQGEVQRADRSGNLLTLDCRLTLVRDSSSEPHSVLVIDTDITDRKKIEQQLMRAQRMESLGTLAGGIAHDLNNALAPIIMALDLLQTRFPDRASQDLLGVISASAHRGADMVRQVLSFARGLDGRRIEVRLDTTAREVARIASDTFLKQHEVRTHIADDLWSVSGDPTQLHQMLMNLVLNARDSMPDGGPLVISTENVDLNGHHAAQPGEVVVGPFVLMQVEDCGSGMTPEIVEKVFDPFFTTKEVGKGTGLGLSTSLAIVKSHGGFIHCYSEPGIGTKFSVYLPAVPKAQLPSPAEVAATRILHGEGELILVVDDEEPVRLVTRRTLETYGYRVELASDGAQAVAAYARRGKEIAVVITDMTMPVMDGTATIQILRRMNPGVRIIAASGLSASAVDSRTHELGVQAFLPKPYTAETMLTTLRELLDPK